MLKACRRMFDTRIKDFQIESGGAKIKFIKSHSEREYDTVSISGPTMCVADARELIIHAAREAGAPDGKTSGGHHRNIADVPSDNASDSGSGSSSDRGTGTGNC